MNLDKLRRSHQRTQIDKITLKVKSNWRIKTMEDSYFLYSLSLINLLLKTKKN